jgi:hypothetical protein
MALLAGAIIQLIITFFAMFMALIITRDVYIVLFAPFYSLDANVASLQFMVLAFILWGFVGPLISLFMEHRRRIAIIIAAVVGILIISFTFFISPFLNDLVPITRSYSPTIFPLWLIIIALLGGGLSGGLTMSLFHALYPLSRRGILLQCLKILSSFAFIWSLLLQSIVALAKGFGLI